MARRGWRWLALACVATGAGACSSHVSGSGADAADATDVAGADVAPDAAQDAPLAAGFERDVFPLLEALGCRECHEQSMVVVRHWALTTAADTYAHWVNYPGFDHCDADGGAITAPQPTSIRVVPGDPDHSLVMKKLTDPWEMCGLFYGHMPPAPRPRLSADQLATIRDWIAAGAAP
jgi:hypothetical protein